VTGLKVCPACGTQYPANARFCEIDGTALRPENAGNDLVGTVVADRYHVLRLLGQGGMGKVYLAEHVKMGRKCALKVLRPAAMRDADAVSRFNREASNASRIAHPNVAAVYDFGETADGIIYLAMEFVDGPSLTALVDELGALPPTRAAEIARQSADGLAAAHDMGIVHRDLKPENLMIAKTRDGTDLVKIVDFGIAKAAGVDAQKVTKTGLVIGTPDYMSPEQLSGDPIDSRSDIYSLGIVAFNMLTGRLPFPGDSSQESMVMRLTDPPKRLREMRPEVDWSADLQSAVDKALARNVTDRYQRAVDFGRDFAAAARRMGDRAPAAKTAPVPSETIPQTRVATAQPRKRSVALAIGGGITALVVVSAALAPILWKDRQPPAPSPTAAPAAPLDVDKELTEAEAEARGPDKTAARNALRRLAALDGRLDAAGDVARAALVRYEAYLLLEDTKQACAALNDVKDAARGTSFQRKVDDRLAACP
jgi:serine/threonine-protein kinase